MAGMAWRLCAVGCLSVVVTPFLLPPSPSPSPPPSWLLPFLSPLARFHGGLQYQIEHHLFPRIPRHNLPAVRPMVEELCRKNGIEYRSASFFTANKRLMGVLKHAAMAARAIRKGELSPEQMKTYPAPEVLSGGLLWDSLNARG